MKSSSWETPERAGQRARVLGEGFAIAPIGQRHDGDVEVERLLHPWNFIDMSARSIDQQQADGPMVEGRDGAFRQNARHIAAALQGRAQQAGGGFQNPASRMDLAS